MFGRQKHATDEDEDVAVDATLELDLGTVGESIEAYLEDPSVNLRNDLLAVLERSDQQIDNSDAYDDIGKVFGDVGHGEGVSAELLKPHLRADLVSVVRHHGAFTARHWDPSLDGELDPRIQYRDEPWYPLAVILVDEWDMKSFDPLFYPFEDL